MSHKSKKKGSNGSSGDNNGCLGKCPARAIPSMNGDRFETFEVKEHPSDSFTQMNELRQNQLLCDVTVKVDYNGQKRKFHAHKLVLASCSSYFKAMFTGGCRESKMSEVSVSCIHPEVFAKLLDFAYTSRIDISEKCVLYIIAGACMLQMNHVVQICCRFLEKQIDPSNCIGLASFACELGCIEFKKKVEKYICMHFGEVSQNDEFKTLTPCQISKIISADEIHVTCESLVYKAVLSWVQYDLPNRRQYLTMLMEAVRCHSLPASFLEKQLEHCPIMNKEPNCKKYLSRIFRELTLHEPVKQKPRDPDIGRVIYVAGGYFRNSLACMECLHTEDWQWMRLRDLPAPRSGLATCVVQGLFYVIGGRNNTTTSGSVDLTTCQRYNPMSDQWDDRNPMNVARNRVGIGVIDNLVYAVGGSHGTEHHASVERYDPDRDEWKMMSSMKTRRIGVGCAVVNRMLYAVGGFDGQHRLSSVEQYHPENDVWCFVQSMLTARSGAGVVAMGDHIYAVGGYDGQDQLSTVERYSVTDNTWQYVASMRHRRSALSVCVLANKIYALGGYDGSAFLSSVELYDPARNEWRVVGEMASGRSGCASAVGFQPCMNR